MLIRSPLLLLGAFSLLAACSSSAEPSETSRDSNANTEGSDGGNSAGGAGAYPAGPYGKNNPQVGEVIADLQFSGLFRIADGEIVSQANIESRALSALKSDFRFAFVHTATMWCSSCRAAADDLAAQGDELSNAGVLVVELLLEGANYGSTPSDSELRSWADSSDLSVSTVRADSAITRDTFTSREYVYLIDLTDMKVMWVEQALYSDPSITERGIAAIQPYLN